MKSFYIKFAQALFLIILILQVSGCGETLQGIGKDARRMGKGVKTIFVREEK